MAPAIVSLELHLLKASAALRAMPGFRPTATRTVKFSFTNCRNMLARAAGELSGVAQLTQHDLRSSTIPPSNWHLGGT